MTGTRDSNEQLRNALNLRRRQMLDTVQGGVRRERTERSADVGDMADASDESMQTAIGMSLLQLQSGTVLRIDEALGRLDSGQYGICVECAAPISAARLDALPFAVRCRPCEDAREGEQARSRRAETHNHLPFANAGIPAVRDPEGP
jgi:DnaK suppressor protein